MKYLVSCSFHSAGLKTGFIYLFIYFINIFRKSKKKKNLKEIVEEHIYVQPTEWVLIERIAINGYRDSCGGGGGGLPGLRDQVRPILSSSCCTGLVLALSCLCGTQSLSSRSFLTHLLLHIQTLAVFSPPVQYLTQCWWQSYSSQPLSNGHCPQ